MASIETSAVKFPSVVKPTPLPTSSNTVSSPFFPSFKQDPRQRICKLTPLSLPAGFRVPLLAAVPQGFADMDALDSGSPEALHEVSDPA